MTAAVWRAMTAGDIPAVTVISDAVHGRFTEPAEIYAERLRLYPAGCFVYDTGARLGGYLIAHPWTALQPPPLGLPLGALPTEPSTFYLHDLALLPETRGQGAGAEAVRKAVAQAIAAGLPEVSLVAIHDAESFWRRQGFATIESDRLWSYGPEARYMVRKLA